MLTNEGKQYEYLVYYTTISYVHLSLAQAAIPSCHFSGVWQHHRIETLCQMTPPNLEGCFHPVFPTCKNVRLNPFFFELSNLDDVNIQSNKHKRLSEHIALFLMVVSAPRATRRFIISVRPHCTAMWSGVHPSCRSKYKQIYLNCQPDAPLYVQESRSYCIHQDFLFPTSIVDTTYM